MAKAKKAASSVGNSRSGTTFGGSTVRNPDPPGFKDPGDAPAQGHLDKGGVVSRKSMKPGGGGRFEAFVSRLVAEGKTTSSAKAIAASAGNKRYGKAQMQSWAQKGKRR